MTKTRKSNKSADQPPVDWSEVEDKYTCVVCKDIVDKPVVQLFCGDRLCGQCFSDHYPKSSKCPGNGLYCAKTDLNNDDHVLPDSPAERDLEKLEVYSPYRSLGCEEVLPLKDMKIHRKQCEFKTEGFNTDEQCVASGYQEEIPHDLEKTKKSKRSPAVKLIQYMKQLHKKQILSRNCTEMTQNGVKVVKLPLVETYRDDVNKIRKVTIGTNQTFDQKTILLVGATGSGKSTMINGFVNYIYGMKFEDNNRLSLVDLECENENKCQSVSQTEWITAYSVPKSSYSSVPYSVTIVDMPGFGDTRGIQHDKELVDHIHKLFSSDNEQGLDSINTVCFVARAGDARLTPTQRYIFDSILSLFGQDIVENIQVLISFADGNKPCVLEALRSAVPFCRTFKFNNSCLFRAGQEEPFSKIYWEMGTQSYQAFFDTLSGMNPKSLILSSEVLRERSRLNLIVEDLQKNIEKTMNQISRINEHALQKQLCEVVKVANQNKNHEGSLVQLVTLKEKVHTDPGVYSTYCPSCDHECHVNCPIQDAGDLEECVTIDREGNCLICLNHCSWSKHVNRDFHYKDVIREVKTTDEEMKQKYINAKTKETEIKQLLKTIENEKRSKEQEVSQMVQELTSCMMKLDRIALKKNHTSHIDYLNLLIEEESQRCEPGYENRIQVYKDLITQQAILEKVQSGRSLLP